MSKKADYAVWNDILQHRLKADILIYGSSRAWVQFNPRILEDSLGMQVYNVGMDGYRFNMQFERHNIIMKFDKKPKFIIHSLDFNTFEKQTELYNAKQFLPYIKIKEIQKITLLYDGLDLYDYFIPFVRYHGQSQAIYHAIGIKVNPRSNEEDRYKGYQGQQRSWTSDLTNAKSLKETYEVKIDSTMLHLFSTYINNIKQNHIKLILVYAPEYYEGQQYVHNRKSVLFLYKQIAKENSIPFLDFSDSSICKDRSKFYNSMHLNDEGANHFTQQLAHLLRNYYIKHP